MTALLIVAHSPLASALKAVAQHTFPDCASQLSAVDVAPDDSPEAIALLLRTATPPAGEPLLMLVDVAGATPANASCAFAAQRGACRVVAGVNVPMLWRVLCYGHEDLEPLLERALAGAARGVQALAPAPFATPDDKEPSR